MNYLRILNTYVIVRIKIKASYIGSLSKYCKKLVKTKRNCSTLLASQASIHLHSYPFYEG
jgi:hypothetical protein